MLILNALAWLWGWVEILDEILELVGYDIIPWINPIP